MNILVLRHEPFEHLGSFAKVLDEKDIPFTYKDLGQPLSTEDSDGVIIMGGPQSANDSAPGIAAETRFIENALARKVPILGICLGAQLIAKALGARVYKNPAKEIGWFQVFFTEAAASDPLFKPFPSPTVFFQWHAETFERPAGSEWLAWSHLCQNQVFRYGTNVYGVQFHPEIESEMIVDWSGQPANCGDVTGLAEQIDPFAFDSRKAARMILDRWLEVAGIDTGKPDRRETARS